MDDRAAEVSSVPNPRSRVETDVNCAICGASLRGLELGGECRTCRTPVMLSVTQGPAASLGHAEVVQDDRLCVKCGRNLKGMPVDGFCPECRTLVAHSAPVVIASGQKVTEDRPCLVCGYNIKGLETEGSCPECGTPLARSLRGFLLRYSAPEYLATLRNGVLLVEATLLLTIVFASGIAVYAMVNSLGTAFTLGPRGPAGATAAMARSNLVFEAVQQIGGMLLKLMGLVGMWMFTTQDPGLTTRDPAHKSRRFLRVFLSISALTAMGGAVLVFLPQMRAQLLGAAGGIPNLPVVLTVLALVGLLSAAAQLVGFIATMNYMAHLSRRIPDAAIEEKAKRFRWLVPVVYVFGCGVGTIIAPILYLLLLEDWRKRLKKLREAQVFDGVSILRVS